MIPENNIKEQLSFAYVNVISSISGRIFEPRFQDYGIDGEIREIQCVDNQISETGINLDLQIKSTSKFEIRDNHIVYKLRNKNYNDLASETSITPRILVLFCIPEDREDWIAQNHNLLELRKCAYWIYLKGKPKKAKKNSATTIKIKKEKMFSVDNLDRIFEKIKKGEDLHGLY